MRFLRLFWVSAIFLFLACLWQGARLQRLLREQPQAPLDTSIAQRYQALQAALRAERKRLTMLEASALTREEPNLLPWLTTQAAATGGNIIGSEQLPTRQEGPYVISALQVEVEGRYDALIRLVNRIERERPRVEIQALRIRPRETAPDTPVLRLVLRTRRLASGEPPPPVATAERWFLQEKRPPLPSTPIQRNPFVPLEPSTQVDIANGQVEAEWPTLHAILWDEGHPTALLKVGVQNVLVGPGEPVGGARVVQIRRNEVVLMRDGRTRTLELWPPVSLVAPSATPKRSDLSADGLGRFPGGSP